MFREKLTLKFKIFLAELFELKRNRIKTLLILLLFIAVFPLIVAIFMSLYYDNHRNVILLLPKSENAKYYFIQVDDDRFFLSPNLEKKVSKEKTIIVLSLEKRNKPYYWRYKIVREDSSEGEWQDQLELKESVPKEDVLFFMEGSSFKIDEPINFYIFARNNTDVLKEFPYDISIRSDAEENGRLDTEIDDIQFGKISVEPKSYKSEKITMRTGDNLQIDRKFYAIASLENYRSTIDFSIVPSYSAIINTKNFERGTDYKAKLMISNVTDDVIKSVKISMSTSSNLKIRDSWNNREITDLGPKMTEFLEWDMEILEIGNAEVTFDILSDGGLHRIQRSINLRHNVSLIVDLPNRNIAINRPTELKVKIANPSEFPVAANLEFVLNSDENANEPIKIEEKTKIVDFGTGSAECALSFSQECSTEVAWNIIGNRLGAYNYYIKSSDSDIQNVNRSSKFGLIHISENESSLDLAIESNEVELEKVTKNRREAVNFDIKLSNFSKSFDVVKVQVIPTGTGWYAHIHDGKELKNNSEFIVNIDPDSSKTFRLILSPYDKNYEGSKFVFSNPMRVEVRAISNINHKNNDKVYASALLEE